MKQEHHVPPICSRAERGSPPFELLDEMTSVAVHREDAFEKDSQDALERAVTKVSEQASTANSIVIKTVASADLAPAPIRPDWILDGTPQAQSRVLAKSHDRTS